MTLFAFTRTLLCALLVSLLVTGCVEVGTTDPGDTTSIDSDGDGVDDDADAFPNDAYESVDTDGDGIGDNADSDDDNDGTPDSLDAFPLDASETTDTDGDGLGDHRDTDDDGDGVPDSLDAFPFDADESVDTDGDRIGNNTDTDDDGDGVPDATDAFPLDPAESIDTDGDGIGNNADTDDDGDGITDSEDPTPLTPGVSLDTDGDGVPDGLDAFPLDADESLDTDGDGIGNNADTDDDGDGAPDISDAFPLNADEAIDTDDNGVGDNADWDDDGDGVADSVDAFPLDTEESVDTDGDGIGNNADTDDDGDGAPDSLDAFPLDADESVDTDGDGVGNHADTDDDGDSVPDTSDAFPVDANEWVDTDGDGTGDNADTDDDGDGVPDTSDAFPLDADESVDTDGDGVGDNSDAFPSDPTEWLDTDGDGIGDNADPEPLVPEVTLDETPFHANATTFDSQDEPRVATGLAGSYMVIWQSQSQDGIADKLNLYGRVFDYAATPLTGEFKINDVGNFGTFPGMKYDVASNSLGKTCVAWGAEGSNGNGAYARCYDSVGIDITGVLTVDTSSDEWTIPEVAIEVFDDGSFVVVYQYGAGYTTGLKAVRYSATNQPGLPYWIDNEGGIARDNDVQIAGDGNGRFAVVWTINDFDIKTKVAVFDATDTQVVSDLVVGDVEGLKEELPDVAMHSDGRFAVITNLYDSSVYDRFLQLHLFSAAGAETYSAVLPTEAGIDVENPKISANDAALYMAWSGYDYGDDNIHMLGLDWNGGELLAEVALDSAYTRLEQIDPAIAIDDLHAVVVWTDKDREEKEAGDTTLNEGIYGVVVPHGEGSGDSGEPVVELASMVGLWDVSEGEACPDEVYMGIDTQGWLTIYDYAGDCYDAYANCYWIGATDVQINHVSDNSYYMSYPDETSMAFTASQDTNGDVVLTPADGEELVLSSTTLSVAEAESMACDVAAKPQLGKPAGAKPSLRSLPLQ